MSRELNVFFFIIQSTQNDVFHAKKTLSSGRVHVRYIYRVKSPAFGFPFDLFIYLFSSFFFRREEISSGRRFRRR